MRIAAPIPRALALLLITASAAAETEQSSPGWLPDTCIQSLEAGTAATMADAEVDASADARWNHHYRLGIDAIAAQDLSTAEMHFCHALDAATGFEPRDIRFAETLDELGLVRFTSGDYEGSEAMQGAAVTEMLLALGPPEENLCETAAKSCRSSVATYMTRLGWIYDRQGRPDDIRPYLRKPYKVFERGYVPVEALRGRLDWLISRYLLREDYAAADWLKALRGR